MLKYKKIALILSLPMLALCFLNLILLIFYNLGNFYNSTLFNVIFSFFVSIVFLLAFFIPYNFSKILQIIGLLLCALYTSIVNKNPEDVSSLILLGYSILLIWFYYKNKLKPSRTFFVLTLTVIILFFIRILSINFLDAYLYKYINFSNYSPHIINLSIRLIFHLVPALLFLFLFMSILWLALIDEVRIYLEKSDKLQIALYKSEGDAWYGRNVLGVIHNIKNKLTPVYLLLEEFSNDERIDEETRDFCKTQIKSVDGLSGLLDKLMYSTKNRHKEDFETININKTIKSIVEFFKSNLEFKKNINLTIKQYGADIYFKGSPMNFCFVIENIIKNSYDNLKNLDQNKRIDIEICNTGDSKYVSIKDNGTGIAFVKEDELFSKSLIDCDFFKIGNTTKNEGLGYGMEFVKSFLIENKINADVYTKKKFGTEIKIFF